MHHKNYLEDLESESIFIIREAVYQFKNPVFLFSIGKDSAVLAHLILKAFFPNKPKFPLLHIDTKWKFKEMIKFRDEFVKKNKLDLITYTNQDGLKKNVNPFTYNSKSYTKIMKTEALLKALKKYKFDCAFGGARRDEEKSRAKERIFSFRDENNTWDPKNQRPELWNVFNTDINQGESVRVFPLSNWSELDVWEYIKYENIKVVPLYFSKKRKFVKRDNNILVVDDKRMKIKNNEKIYFENIRFRSLGCYPLTTGFASKAKNINQIIKEIKKNRISERQNRLIDRDEIGSM
tara:strand:+ start:909 stop:1784 length:876 start_codon:yes stop_codon:yes gene_type:complete